MEEKTKALIQGIVSPWFSISPPKLGRYRPGWTRRLDMLAKKRTRLLRYSDADGKKEPQLFDKRMKR